jgi:hypothetical protein
MPQNQKIVTMAAMTNNYGMLQQGRIRFQGLIPREATIIWHSVIQ